MGRFWQHCFAAEITAVTGKDPGEHYKELTAEFDLPCYTADRRRGDAPEQKAKLGKLSASSVKEVDPGRRGNHRQA